MSPARFGSVEDYLASLEAPKAQTVGAIIEFVLGAFPELDAKLSWNVPQLHRDGTYVLGLSAAKKHVSVSPWSTHVIEDFRPRLEQRFIVTRNLFQVPVDWEIDEVLLTDLVRARLAELD
jgi:uncharacterized protein YdhG (YjbR/CyaY superfamily)